MIPKIRGVREHCNDGTVFVWRSPYSWRRYAANGSVIDSSRQSSGMSTEAAHAYCDQHSTRQELRR